MRYHVTILKNRWGTKGAILTLSTGFFVSMIKQTVLVLLFAITASFGLMAYKNTTDKGAARARQIQGLYIFTDCTPAGEYEVLGTVKRSGATSFKSSQYESVRDILIDRAKKEYPMGEGIIFDLRTGGTDKADVIRFK